MKLISHPKPFVAVMIRSLPVVGLDAELVADVGLLDALDIEADDLLTVDVKEGPVDGAEVTDAVQEVSSSVDLTKLTSQSQPMLAASSRARDRDVTSTEMTEIVNTPAKADDAMTKQGSDTSAKVQVDKSSS